MGLFAEARRNPGKSFRSSVKSWWGNPPPVTGQKFRSDRGVKLV